MKLPQETSVCKYAQCEPIIQNNYMRNTVYADKLHHKAVESISCTNNYCVGSFLLKGKPAFSEKSKAEKINEATLFIEEYYESLKKNSSKEHVNRIKEILETIETTGFYELTSAELEFGTRTAWRNAARCPGRIFWPKLELIDARDVTTEEEMFEYLCNLLRYVASDKGNIKSAICVFRQRKALDKDFRIWNSQLISYAGYRVNENEYIGDKAQIEFTQACEKLGWKGEGTDFDVLPIVVQANGNAPKYFELPKDLILEVPLTHPNYDFESLNLKYFAVVSFATFLFDIGGCQFTAAPFTAFYSAPEISRALADFNRFNKLKLFAEKMNLDTGSNVTLWKDRAIIEINYSILYSFKKHQVAVTDHHTISEQFKKFFETEHKQRGGCPADWVWVNPQYSTHMEDAFHIEMINYKLRPSIEYQIQGWKYAKEIEIMRNVHKVQNFKSKLIACNYSVIFANYLMRKIMQKRIKCTVLYATETKTSEEFANSLVDVFNYSYNTKVICMEEYDINQLSKENFLVVVASTYGNGDAPGNGENFKNALINIKKNLENIEESPFKNLNFSVFALGSSTYPNFCSFGKLINNLLADIGANRICSIGIADDNLDQKKSFKKWSFECFKNSAKHFSIDFKKLNFSNDQFPSECESYRLNSVENKENFNLINSLNYWHKRTINTFSIKAKQNLQHESSGRKSLWIKLESNNKETSLKYQPGDHVGIIPANRKQMVEFLLNRIEKKFHSDDFIRVQCKKTANGEWFNEERFPTMSLRYALKYFYDINTPLKQSVIKKLAQRASDINEKNKLNELANNEKAYEEWKNLKFPNLVEFLTEFGSVFFDDLFVFTELPKLQPRFYSISSSPLDSSNSIELTMRVVEYTTNKGDQHYGVCTKWLDDADQNEIVHLFTKEATNFHLPNVKSKPIIMIGAGTGIAPFRSFWLQRKHEQNFGEMHLYFGCRSSLHDDLYKQELDLLIKDKVIASVRKAYSREPGQKKEYVQDIIERDSENIFDLVCNKQAHVYICGSIDMADSVKSVLAKILKGNNYIQKMKEEHRFHEDIYTILVAPKKH